MILGPEKAPSPRAHKGKHLFLIDGYGFLFRAYHSMPPLTRADGTPVGAIYGFTNMLLKLRQKIEENNRKNPEDHYMAVVLDSGRKSFRNDIYPEYKANRPPAPEDLIPQFPIVREAVKALHVPVLEKEGFEADDLIATYTRMAREESAKVTIVSSDKDLMQLVGGDVWLYDAMKEKEIRAKEVEEKFGVPPEQVLDALALIGDSSDNIPGVPGIGPKTAAELLKQFGSLDGVLSHTSEIKQQKRRESLEQFAEQARLSKKLAALCDTAPAETPIENLALKELDAPALITFLKDQNFRSLVARVEKMGGALPAPTTGETSVLPKPSAPTRELKLSATQKPLKEKKDFEELTLEAEMHGKLSLLFTHQSLYLATSEKEVWVLPMAAKASQHDLFSTAEKGTASAALKPLKALLENEAVLKIGHDVKCVARMAIEEKIKPQALDDVMVMSYVVDGTMQAHSIEILAQKYLNLVLEPADEKTTADEKILGENAANAAASLLLLHEKLRKQLTDDAMMRVYETIERPLILTLAKMEARGVKVNVKELSNISEALEKRMRETEKKIFATTGHEFNIGSPKQLGEVLFDEMGIEGGKKSKKSGAYGTGADVLEELADKGFDIATDVLEWRQVSKLKSTYTDALPQSVSPKTGRIHTTFMMTVTNTGRLSSQHPNLQNIPVRSEEGKLIRGAFIAEEGYELISADYSQIELRLLADFADIKPLKEAFAHGIDIHAKTASQIFEVPVDKVDGNMRRSAKAINFGIIYGQSAFGLARGLGIGRAEAQKYIEAYFREYPGIHAFMEESKEYARKHGYVKTYFGRKCYLPGITSKNPALRQFSERAAINAPLQGTAADVIKRAMVQLDKELEKKIPEASIILQVHDELLLEAPHAKAKAAAELTKKVMEEAIDLSVPLTAEVATGKNWGEIHG